MSFLTEYKDRYDLREITGSTIRNYIKVVELLCEMNYIAIPWKKITRGLPKGRRWADDRAPSTDEIRRLCENPDRRIKPLVYTMCSSGIRPLVYEKWYSKVLIHASKNYMGVDGDTGKLIVKGLVGKKSNQCELVKQVFIRVRDYWKNDVGNSELESYIKPIIESLDNKTIDVEMLRERSKIHQDPKTGYVNSPETREGLKHETQEAN